MTQINSWKTPELNGAVMNYIDGDGDMAIYY